VDAPSVQSKYKFADFKNGFSIFAKDRRPVHVKFNGATFFCVVNPDFTPGEWTTGYGMFEFSRLMHQIVQTLMADWKPPPDKVKPDGKFPYKIRTWAMNNTTLALSKRVNAKRLELIKEADQRYVDAQRAYYACCGKYHPHLIRPALYREENKYVLTDICKYRAAAMTVPDMIFNKDGDFQGWGDFSPYYRLYSDSYDTWMRMYCKDKPNTSLRKTLMNLPGGIPYRMLKDIADRELERPYYNRLELLSYLQVLDYRRDTMDRNVRIINRSTQEQIRKALRMIYAHLRQEKTQLRKVQRITTAINYIFDCTDNHNGHIVGMADKSIRWHRAGRYANEVTRCKFPPSTATKLPPILLPTDNRIRFLDTVQAVFDESVAMQHCVSGYAGNAVLGDCYLFHIDHRKECATVEVSPRGYVVQSRGPSNCSNLASKWGQRVLEVWAKTLSVGVTPPQVHDVDPIPEALEGEFAEIPF
jgi:hypothetical protein